MAGREWRLQRTVRTKDTTGRSIDVTVGLARDHEGELKGMIGIDDGPSAALDTGQMAELIVNLRQTAATLQANEQGRP